MVETETSRKKKIEDQDPRLENIFEPKQKRRTAKKCGGARVIT